MYLNYVWHTIIWFFPLYWLLFQIVKKHINIRLLISFVYTHIGHKLFIHILIIGTNPFVPSNNFNHKINLIGGNIEYSTEQSHTRLIFYKKIRKVKHSTNKLVSSGVIRKSKTLAPLHRTGKLAHEKIANAPGKTFTLPKYNCAFIRVLNGNSFLVVTTGTLRCACCCGWWKLAWPPTPHTRVSATKSQYHSLTDHEYTQPQWIRGTTTYQTHNTRTRVAMRWSGCVTSATGNQMLTKGTFSRTSYLKSNGFVLYTHYYTTYSFGSPPQHIEQHRSSAAITSLFVS